MSGDLLGTVVVARVKGLWGNQGAVRVEVFTDFHDLFEPGAELCMGDTLVTVEWARWHRDDLVLQLKGLPPYSESNHLHNSEITVLESALPSLEKGFYYHYQLLGLRVMTERGEELGDLTDIITTGATDVYVVGGERGKELLFPATVDVVRVVDLNQGFMVVNLMEWLH